MKLNNAVKMLAKAAGSVEQDGDLFRGVVGEYVVSFNRCSANGCTGPDVVVDHAQGFHICRKGLKADPQTDYYPGTWCGTLTQAVRLARLWSGNLADALAHRDHAAN